MVQLRDKTAKTAGAAFRHLTVRLGGPLEIRQANPRLCRGTGAAVGKSIARHSDFPSRSPSGPISRQIPESETPRLGGKQPRGLLRARRRRTNPIRGLEGLVPDRPVSPSTDLQFIAPDRGGRWTEPR